MKTLKQDYYLFVVIKHIPGRKHVRSKNNIQKF